jgi:hypothetical protein
MLARNVPTEESRLVRMTETDFRRVYPAELHDKLAFREESSGIDGSAGEGELWRTLGIVMMLALLVETVLAWRFGRR